MDYAKESLRLHYAWRGKLEMTPRAEVDSKEALSLAYTPGVAQPCLEIQKDVSKSYELTRRWNTVAVVTDGSAVLGLGDIGPEAGMPVMEGKCVLFKAFGGVDAIPLCVRSHDVDDIVNTVALLAGSFGGVNLEDIAAPRCFEIERKLKERCDIPIFHDDQHGTAIITLAGLTNALKVVGKKLEDVRIVINGAGAAAVSITKLLLSAGAKGRGRSDEPEGRHLRRPERGHELDQGGDGPGDQSRKAGRVPGGHAGRRRCVHRCLCPWRRHRRHGADHGEGPPSSSPAPTPRRRSFRMTPEPAAPPWWPPAAATIPIRSTTCWPSRVFRGALDARASDINDPMKIAAARALADLVGSDLSADYIIPAAFDPRVKDAVAAAVKQAAYDSGVARI